MLVPRRVVTIPNKNLCLGGDEKRKAGRSAVATKAFKIDTDRTLTAKYHEPLTRSFAKMIAR